MESNNDSNRNTKTDADDVAPLCNCGCGQPVKRSTISGEWNKYRHGHNSISLPPNSGQFKPGNKFSKGRKARSQNKVTIAAKNLLEGEVEELTRTAIESAKNGNTQMLQFCLARVGPPPVKDAPVDLKGMPECKDLGSAIELSNFILQKLEANEITPSQAQMLFSIVDKHIGVLQRSDVEARLEAMEEMLEQRLGGE